MKAKDPHPINNPSKPAPTLAMINQYKAKQKLRDALALLHILAPQNLFRTLLSASIHHQRRYRYVFSIDEFVLANKQGIPTALHAKHLDIGCGASPRNPFKAEKAYGVDKIKPLSENVLQEDIISNPLPFPGNSFEFCSAFDFIEHIPRTCISNQKTITPFIDFMNEVHRILKPNGLFLHFTPSLPSPHAFTDPTHVNFITEDTFPQYFCGSSPGARTYGFTGFFELVDQAWIRDIWIAGILKKQAF